MAKFFIYGDSDSIVLEVDGTKAEELFAWRVKRDARKVRPA